MFEILRALARHAFNLLMSFITPSMVVSLVGIIMKKVTEWVIEFVRMWMEDDDDGDSDAQSDRGQQPQSDDHDESSSIRMEDFQAKRQPRPADVLIDVEPELPDPMVEPLQRSDEPSMAESAAESSGEFIFLDLTEDSHLHAATRKSAAKPDDQPSSKKVRSKARSIPGSKRRKARGEVQLGGRPALNLS